MLSRHSRVAALLMCVLFQGYKATDSLARNYSLHPTTARKNWFYPATTKRGFVLFEVLVDLAKLMLKYTQISSQARVTYSVRCCFITRENSNKMYHYKMTTRVIVRRVFQTFMINMNS